MIYDVIVMPMFFKQNFMMKSVRIRIHGSNCTKLTSICVTENIDQLSTTRKYRKVVLNLSHFTLPEFLQ